MIGSKTVPALAAIGIMITQAFAACEQWDVQGEKTIIQSNDIAVITKFEQDGATLSGTARYLSKSLPDKSEEWLVLGELAGTIEGNEIQFRVSWEADYYSDSGIFIGTRRSWSSTGIYEGSIGEAGAVTGSSFDIKDASNKVGWRLLESATCAAPSTPAPQAEVISSGMENDTDRAGFDYRSFFLDARKPDLCRDACIEDGDRCKAWTYVRPGVQGDKAVCYLKDRTPETSANTCCISGIPPKKSDTVKEPGGFAPTAPDKSKGAAAERGGFVEIVGPGMENNTDRPGSDYNRFVLTAPDPKNCQTACNADQSCAAWTYVRPGVQQKEAICYVKRPARAPVANDCCISGKKPLNPAAVSEPQ